MTERWSGHRQGQPEYRRILIAMFAAGFATFAQLFDMQAVLPLISGDFEVSPSMASLTVSATTLGLGLSVLPWSAAADRLGRVRAMQLSLMVSAAAALVTPFLPTFELVVFARAIVGASLGAVPAVAMAYLAEEVRRDVVTLAASVYVAGNTLGGMTGRLTSGVLGELIGWRASLVVVAVLVAVSALLFFCLVPVPRGFTPGCIRTSTVFGRVFRCLGSPDLLGLYLHGFLVMGAFTAMYNYLGFRLLGSPFHVEATLVSLLFLVYLAGTAASWLAVRLARRIGVRPVILYGVLMMLAGAAMTLAASVHIIYLGLALFTMGCFSSQPLASGLSGKMVEVGRAQATALYQFSWLAGASLFGWFGGVLFDAAGWLGILCLIVALIGSAACLAWVNRQARSENP